MGCLVSAGFFLRFWVEGRDRFFLLFTLSFLLEALNRVMIGLAATPSEARPWLYGVRLLAYLLIIIAVVDKNRARSRSHGSSLDPRAGLTRGS
jgi:hypothetical protein